VVTAKLFVGVQTDYQQPVHLAGFKGFTAFELAADEPARPAQLLRVHPVGGIAQGIVADAVVVADPLLPLGQLGFFF